MATTPNQLFPASYSHPFLNQPPALLTGMWAFHSCHANKNYVHAIGCELSKKFHLAKYDLPTKFEAWTLWNAMRDPNGSYFIIYSSSLVMYASFNLSLRNNWELLDIGEVDDGGDEYNPANLSLYYRGNNWQYSVVDISFFESKYSIFEMGLESILPLYL